MKDYLAKLIFILMDFAVIFISITLAYLLRDASKDMFVMPLVFPLSNYTQFYLIYLVPAVLFAYEGIYTYRYDFWHESRLVFKALLFSFVIIFAYLAMTKSIQGYSRVIIIFSFIFMAILIPFAKNITKKWLYVLGLWRREVKIYGDDPFLRDEIFINPYLGYVEAKSSHPKTIFVNSKDTDPDELRRIINTEVSSRAEVIFIPLINDYNLTHSHIYELSNTRTNLIVFQNRLKSKSRLILKRISDAVLSMLIFPLLTPILIIIAYKIKKEEPNGSILFKQERMGQDDQVFICYKFRTMHEDGDTILKEYLQNNPDEVAYYSKYHKYQNDPRITKVGHFLRRTSLDELPQIFNALKGEMSFIGPRPYMLSERSKVGEALETILAVRPGITGLWQVSGRSDVDFESRVELDVWYIRNWNLWMDLVILVKTIKTVLVKEGAS